MKPISIITDLAVIALWVIAPVIIIASILAIVVLGDE